MAPPVTPAADAARTQRDQQRDAAVAKLEGRLNRIDKLPAELQKHQDATNPHGVTKAQVGLEYVENLPLSPVGPLGNGYAGAKDVYSFSMANFLPKDAIFPFASVVLGREAGHYGGNLGNSVLIGNRAGRSGVVEFRDYVAIGADTHPLASKTVTLGHSSDTFVMPKGPVTRADKRDFKEVKDLDLGLDFVLLLHPKIGQMDLREDYIDYASMPIPPSTPDLPPMSPVSDEKNPLYHREWANYREAVATWKREVDTPYQAALTEWRSKYRAWKTNNQLAKVTPDGSKAQSPQAMLLADDLANAADILKKEFTGVVDFKQLGGLDVKGQRLEEMVPVLVKAIQDLHEYVHSDGFIDRMVDQMLKKGKRGRDALRHAAAIVKQDQAEDAHEAALAAEPPPSDPA